MIQTTQPASAPAMQAKAWKAAQDFEAVTLDQFLSPMFATIDLSKTPFGGGEAEKTWQSMFVTELGKQMQRAGGVGIARSVYGEMLRMQEQGDRQKPPAPRSPTPSTSPTQEIPQ
jgi:flagellar protein FlgJ